MLVTQLCSTATRLRSAHKSSQKLLRFIYSFIFITYLKKASRFERFKREPGENPGQYPLLYVLHQSLPHYVIETRRGLEKAREIGTSQKTCLCRKHECAYGTMGSTVSFGDKVSRFYHDFRQEVNAYFPSVYILSVRRREFLFINLHD